MALNSEDKADVSRHMGKALAKKVQRATSDYGAHFKGEGDGASQKRNDLQRAKFKMQARKYDRENPKPASKWHGPRGTIGQTLAYNKSDSPDMTAFKRSYSRKIQKREKQDGKLEDFWKRRGKLT